MLVAVVYRLVNILSPFGSLFSGLNLFHHNICWKKCISECKKGHRRKSIFPRSFSFLSNQPVYNRCPTSLTPEQATLNLDFTDSMGVCGNTEHFGFVALGLICTYYESET